MDVFDRRLADLGELRASLTEFVVSSSEVLPSAEARVSNNAGDDAVLKQHPKSLLPPRPAPARAVSTARSATLNSIQPRHSQFAWQEKPCPPLCRCQCHRVEQYRSPDWALALLGSWYVRYKRSSCNSLLCGSRSDASIKIQYCLPHWLAYRFVDISFSPGSLTGLGYLMWVRVLNVG